MAIEYESDWVCDWVVTKELNGLSYLSKIHEEWFILTTTRGARDFDLKIFEVEINTSPDSDNESGTRQDFYPISHLFNLIQNA